MVETFLFAPYNGGTDKEVVSMLAENLTLLRNIRGMTQEEVAEVVGISRQPYSKWEQGKTIPDIEKCGRLAKFYGVSIDALVHQDEAVGKARVHPPRWASTCGERWRWVPRGRSSFPRRRGTPSI